MVAAKHPRLMCQKFMPGTWGEEVVPRYVEFLEMNASCFCGCVFFLVWQLVAWKMQTSFAFGVVAGPPLPPFLHPNISPNFLK